MFIYVCYFVSVNLFLYIALQIEWVLKKNVKIKSHKLQPWIPQNPIEI